MLNRTLLFFMLIPSLSMAAMESPKLQSANVNLHDKASLQRGAKYYMNYCAGCHSLQYQRYNRMAKDIGVAYYTGEVDDKLLKENLIFTGAKPGDQIRIAMNMHDAKKWFGIAPPDLTLETRVRGSDWVYTYLLSFYEDESAPWGSNNAIFDDVAMPNVLGPLQGRQIPVYRKKQIKLNGEMKTIDVIDHLQSIGEGTHDQVHFEKVAHDIVNFLTYVGEPIQTKRQTIGFFVLLFLSLMVILTYSLKKEFWRDIKK